MKKENLEAGKEAIEEAAEDWMEKDCYEHEKHQCKKAFVAGANWQAKQATPVKRDEDEGEWNAETWTAEELEKSFLRSTGEGWQDVTINGKKQHNFHTLVNASQAKEWFKWLASLKVLKQLPTTSSIDKSNDELK